MRSRCLQEEGPSPDYLALHLNPPQVNDIYLLRGDAGPCCLPESLDLSPDPTHPVDPDLEGGPGLIPGPGLIQDPGAHLALKLGPALDPDLSPTLDPGQGQGPGHILHPERRLHPDLRESEKAASRNQTP